MWVKARLSSVNSSTQNPDFFTLDSITVVEFMLSLYYEVKRSFIYGKKSDNR